MHHHAGQRADHRRFFRTVKAEQAAVPTEAVQEKAEAPPEAKQPLALPALVAGPAPTEAEVALAQAAVARLRANGAPSAVVNEANAYAHELSARWRVAEDERLAAEQKAEE